MTMAVASSVNKPNRNPNRSDQMASFGSVIGQRSKMSHMPLGTDPARMGHLTQEPGGSRRFVHSNTGCVLLEHISDTAVTTQL